MSDRDGEYDIVVATGLPDQPSSEDMATLCRQAAGGDSEALERLLYMHHPRLLSFARRRVGAQWQGKIEAEDLLQEAYVDAFAMLGEFECRDSESFYRWVTRIIDHRLGDLLRYWRTQKRAAPREGSLGSNYGSLLERCLPRGDTPSRALLRGGGWRDVELHCPAARRLSRRGEALIS